MKAFTTLAWLRWRLLANESELEWFYLVAILSVILLCLGAGISVGIVLLHPQIASIDGEHLWIGAVSGLFTFGIVMLFLLKQLMSGSILRELDFKLLRHLPVPKFTLLVFDLLVGSLDLLYLTSLAFLLGFLVGLGIFFDSFPTFLLLLFFVTVSLFGVRFMIEILTELGRMFGQLPSKAKFAAMIVGGFLILFLFFFAFTDSSSTILHIGPFSWISWGLHELVFRKEVGPMLRVTIDCTWIVVGASLIFVALHNAGSSISSNKAVVHGNCRHVSSLQKLLFIFPEELVPHVTKELLLLGRSKQFKRNIFFVLLFLLLSGYTAIINPTNDGRYFALLPMTLFMPIVIWDSYFNNCFGHERSSFSFHLLTSTQPRTLFLAKNATLAILVAPSLMPGWLVLAYAVTIASIPLFILTQVSFFFFLMTFSNKNSIRSAHPVELDKSGPVRGPSGADSILNLISMFISVAVGGVGLVIEWVFKTSLMSYILLFLLALGSILVYRASLMFATRMFAENSELMYEKLRKQ
jgi:hypothetical protein